MWSKSPRVPRFLVTPSRPTGFRQQRLENCLQRTGGESQCVATELDGGGKQQRLSSRQKDFSRCGFRDSSAVGRVPSSLAFFLSSYRSAYSRTLAMMTEPRQLLTLCYPIPCPLSVLTDDPQRKKTFYCPGWSRVFQWPRVLSPNEARSPPNEGTIES